jgi:hypothetical protein
MDRHELHSWVLVGEPHPVARCKRCGIYAALGWRSGRGRGRRSGPVVEYSDPEGEVLSTNRFDSRNARPLCAPRPDRTPEAP